MTAPNTEPGPGNVYVGAANAPYWELEHLWIEDEWYRHDGFDDAFRARVEERLRREFRYLVVGPWKDEIEWAEAPIVQIGLVDS